MLLKCRVYAFNGISATISSSADFQNRTKTPASAVIPPDDNAPLLPDKVFIFSVLATGTSLSLGVIPNWNSTFLGLNLILSD